MTVTNAAMAAGGSQQWGSLALAWMSRLGVGYRGQDERLHMGVNIYGDK